MAIRKPPYEIGYGRPPKSGQFVAGASGNPKGRPKGSKNLATVVLRAGREMVTIRGPRGPRKITKLEAAVAQLNNKAAQGDLASQRTLFALVRESEDSIQSQSGPLTPRESDERVMQNLLRRMEQINMESQPAGTPGEGEPSK